MSGQPTIRFAIHRDLREIIAIDSFAENPLRIDEWEEYYRRRCFRIVVIGQHRRIEAACVMRVRRDAIFFERIVAAPDFPEMLAASMFIAEICENLPDEKRLVLQVDEYELDWQLFLQERGFLATANIRGAGYDDSDVIQFEFGQSMLAALK